MSEKQYLNEEKYQKTKNKITIVAILILVIGLLIGGGLIATGLNKYNQVQLSDEEINEVHNEIDGYNNQLASLKAQLNQERRNNGFSEKYYNLENQIDKVEDKIEVLEEKLDPKTSHLVIFYMFGGFIIFVTIVISSVTFKSARGREIIAFSVQQAMPVAQESIEKIAPSAGKAAKEIAKGIKEGLKDEE